MAPRILLLTTSSTPPRLRGLSAYNYAADPGGVERALDKLAPSGLVWLEPASEIYYWEAAALARLVGHVEGGGGLLVSGGIGEGFLFRTLIEEMLPARAVFQEDSRPQHHVRDVKPFADSVWFTSGEIVVEAPKHPILHGVGLKSGMKLARSYVAESKPGARVLVRFATYESVHSKFDLEPLDMPCLATWCWGKGRVTYLASDVGALPPGAKWRTLVENVAGLPPPSAKERADDRLGYLNGTHAELRRRADVLAALGAPPDTALLDELERRLRKTDVSSASGRNAFLKAVPELEELAHDAAAALEAAEAGLFRDAFEAYKAFYGALARAEIVGALPEAQLAKLRHEGELAKLHFNARAYLQAARTYRALARSVSAP